MTDLAQRLRQMKAYPLGLAGQSSLVGIEREWLPVIREAADRIEEVEAALRECVEAAQASP